jgi:serine-type D-Ala-D-Ala endopeptidase (penicillin-binding protein 7)
MKIFLVVLGLLLSATVSAAPGVWVYNETLDKHVESRNLNPTRPIASLTKIMTAMVTLDYDPNLTREIRVFGSKLPKSRHSRYDVVTAMLVRSDNGAADSIAADYPGGRKEFIKAMNRKARELNMLSTTFRDPSGLSSMNRSTAADVMTMMQVSAVYNIIRETSTKKQAIFETFYKKKIRTIELPNTNRPLLFKFDEIVVSKTGWTNAAGWCVGMVVEAQGQRFIVVILGARSKQERFDIAKEVMYNHLRDIDIEEMTKPKPTLPTSRWDFFGF